MKKLLILISLAISLLADTAGELSFYLMKDGKPIADQSVSILEKKDSKHENFSEFTTDSDGYISAILPVGVYQLQVVIKDKKQPQAFVRKNFVIEDSGLPFLIFIQESPLAWCTFAKSINLSISFLEYVSAPL